MAAKKQTILGVDPGTLVMGYGILDIDEKSNLSVPGAGVISMKHLNDPFTKLQRIFEKTLYLIDQFQPDVLAIEAPFFGKNVQSMLKLGRAQGTVIAAALAEKIEVAEYAPKKIKQSITGNGNASKEQVAAMLEQQLKMKISVKFLDATDGLATALCHHYQSSSVLSQGKKFSGWGDFIKQNPDKTL